MTKPQSETADSEGGPPPVDLTPSEPFASGRTVGRLCLDTCVIIGINNRERFIADEQASLDQLLRLRREAIVELVMTGTAWVERGGLNPDEQAWARRLETAGMIMLHDPYVEGHSAPETSVQPSPDDEARFSTVLRIVHPRALRRDTPGDNDLRDAMHIATAIRYGSEGLVTTDSDVLRAKAGIATCFAGFQLMLPSEAVAWVEQRRAASVRTQRALEELRRRLDLGE